jgi:hypothetical protein
MGLTTVVGRGSDVMGLTTVVGRGSDVINSLSYATLNKFTPAKKHFHVKKPGGAGGGVNLTTRSHPVPRLRSSGAVPLLHQCAFKVWSETNFVCLIIRN